MIPILRVRGSNTRRTAVLDAEAAVGWVLWVLEVFKAGLAKACGGEAGKFGAGEGPGDLFVRLGLLAAATDDEEAVLDEGGDGGNGLGSKGTG